MRTGPLLPETGEEPVYAQLYVYDAELESTQRFQNMRFPGSTTNAQKSVLKQVLKIAQNVIHEHNPYVQDFKQIIEMTDDDFSQSENMLRQIEEKREALIQQFEKETDADGEEYDDAS